MEFDVDGSTFGACSFRGSSIASLLVTTGDLVVECRTPLCT